MAERRNDGRSGPDLPSNGFVNNRKSPVLIGVAGGTASGKSSVCTKIMEKIGQEHKRQVGMVSQDSFYKSLTEENRHKAEAGTYNFDHPEAFDENLIVESLTKLKNNSIITVPRYSLKDHAMVANEQIDVHPADVILVEGILIFYYPEVRSLFNIKIFVDTDADTRLAKRVTRDTKDLGRGLDLVLWQYENLVKPAYEEFCLPTKKYADVIIPRGADNEPAIDLIVQHIQGLLRSPRATPGSEDGSESGFQAAAIFQRPPSTRPH